MHEVWRKVTIFVAVKIKLRLKMSLKQRHIFMPPSLRKITITAPRGVSDNDPKGLAI